MTVGELIKRLEQMDPASKVEISVIVDDEHYELCDIFVDEYGALCGAAPADLGRVADADVLSDEPEHDCEKIEARYGTALRILEDAGVSERDLELVESSVDPVGVLRRWREATS